MCLESLGPWLHRVITKVWLSETVPNNWSEAVLLPLFKKGDKRICSNYRGISLIDVAAKVFGVILLKRFKSERDQRTRPSQSGLRPGRGCTDQMHNLRHTLEQRWSFQQGTRMCFVDFASAFDSLDRDSLWWIMVADGMPPKLLRLIKAYYLSTKMKVRASGSDSMPFEIRSGVRKGCALSPTLFNYIKDWILGQALQNCSGVSNFIHHECRCFLYHNQKF